MSPGELTTLDVGHVDRGEDGWLVELRLRFPEAEATAYVPPEYARQVAAAIERQADFADAHNAGAECEACA